jgi:hypothetical protein
MEALFKSRSLRKRLAEWTDGHIATYYMAMGPGIATDPWEQ